MDKFAGVPLQVEYAEPGTWEPGSARLPTKLIRIYSFGRQWFQPWYEVEAEVIHVLRGFPGGDSSEFELTLTPRTGMVYCERRNPLARFLRYWHRRRHGHG